MTAAALILGGYLLVLVVVLAVCYAAGEADDVNAAVGPLPLEPEERPAPTGRFKSERRVPASRQQRGRGVERLGA